MSSNDPEKLADTLVRLGLTQNQAKLYLANLRTGCATVQVIAKTAGVARQDAYRLFPYLQDLGLITQHIGKPLCYEATEPNEVMSLLIGEKSKQLAELRKQALDFVAYCPKKRSLIQQADDFIQEEFYLMVTNLDVSVQKMVDAFRSTRNSYDVTSGYDRFIARMNMPEKSTQLAEMWNAVKRGVIIRTIIDQPKSRQKIPLSKFENPKARALANHPNFQYRYIDTDNVGLFGIWDNRLMFIEMHQGPKVLLPQLWSNNEVLLGLCKAFFDSAWKFSYDPQ